MIIWSLFYYCHYYFSLVFFYLVLLFIKWLCNDLLNFSFCKCISSHPASIYSKVVLLTGEQILAGWDPTYQTLDVTVDFTFRTCICGYCKKKCSPLHEKCLYSDFFLVPVFPYPKTLNMDTFHALCRSESLTQFSTDSYYYVFSAKSTQAILYILNRVHF